MVYRVQAGLIFANSSARTAALTTIQSAASGRPVTAANSNAAKSSGPVLRYEATGASAIDVQAIYAIIAGLTTPVAGSVAHWHACYHGDRIEHCARAGEKAW